MDKKIVASSHYVDLKGEIKIDEDDTKSLIRDILKEKGIRIENKLSLALSFQKNKVFNSVEIYVTDLKFDEIEEYKKNNKSIPIITYIFDMSIDEIFKYTKRFNFLVTPNEIFYNLDVEEIKRIEK